MNHRVTQIRDAAVVVLVERELDGHHAVALQQSLLPLLDRHTRIVLDLNHLRSISGAGIDAFLAVLHQAQQKGRDLKICGLRKPVRLIFELLHLHRLVDLCASQEAALQTEPAV